MRQSPGRPGCPPHPRPALVGLNCASTCKMGLACHWVGGSALWAERGRQGRKWALFTCDHCVKENTTR